MLLDVIDATGRIDLSANQGAFGHRGLREVNYAAVITIGNFEDSHLFSAVDTQASDVMHLSAAGGIERSPVQDHARFAIEFHAFNHARVEGEEVRVVIVKAVCWHFVLGLFLKSRAKRGIPTYSSIFPSNR